MNILLYIKLLLKYRLWLILMPILCAVTVFILTIHSKKQFVSYTTLYTGVASGYSITSTEDEKLDYFAVNNAFDNLVASAKSREAIEQVALHLLAEHLSLAKPDPHQLGETGFEALKTLAGPDLMSKAAALKTPEKIYEYINGIYSSKAVNKISKIFEAPGTFYNINDLKSNIVVTRINTSDMLQITYTCTDPAVCQRTLELHSGVFTDNYRKLKSDQTYNAVQYFETKMAEANDKLQKSEDDLKQFGQDHHIINYYEQTRYVAQSKEELEKQIYAEKMTKKASEQALNFAQNNLNDRNNQVDNSLKVIDLRQRLSDVNTAYEKAQVFSNPQKMKALALQSKALEDSVKAASDQYMNLNYTTETVPRASLMQEWVDNSVASKKATAGLDVLNKQNGTYEKKFEDLAPLGSTLKRLERQIDINQNEFLAILHGLNLARLRQSNIALNANIAVQDKPFFPLEAQPSTRNLLVIISFIVGFILVAATVIIGEVMDSSIRSPERAVTIVGLPLAGIAISKNKQAAAPYRPHLQSLLTEQMINTIIPYLQSGSRQQISFMATHANVFNSADIGLLHGYLKTLFTDVCWVVPQIDADVFETALPKSDLAIYEPAIRHLTSKNIQDLVSKDLIGYALVCYVTPDFTQNGLPLGIINQSDINLLVVNANDTWQAANKAIFNKINTSVTNAPILTWLVGADESHLDGVIGEIPKSRSWFRKKIKKILSLNLARS